MLLQVVVLVPQELQLAVVCSVALVAVQQLLHLPVGRLLAAELLLHSVLQQRRLPRLER